MRDIMRVTITWTRKGSIWASKQYKTVSFYDNERKYKAVIKMIEKLTKDNTVNK